MSAEARSSDRTAERNAMVQHVADLMARTFPETGVDELEPEVRGAMQRVPRHRFVPEELQDRAYSDSPLPLGFEQTISQPFIVGLMTQLAALRPDSIVLEVGTGSGYQAAVLGELAQEVYSIEIVPELAERARGILEELGYANVTTRYGDGYEGWPEHAPFDAILVTAAIAAPPAPLLEQLAPGGRMVIPLGTPGRTQDLVLIRKRDDGSIETIHELPVAFVPLTRQEPGPIDGETPRRRA